MSRVPYYVNPRSHEYVTQEGVGVELASIAAGGTGTRFRVGSVTRVKIPHSQEWFEEVARKATRNPDSDKLVLGHFATEGSSYQKVASHYKATYFKVEDWNKVTKGMTADEIWKINKSFLDQQLKKGKRILLSHDPSKARPRSFYEKEINRLRNLGYNFKQINQWTWEAIK